ncbi:CDP-alcohol phosphatidyltransferase family protein [Neisseria canis]|uniref:CDP-alcohol phosphatidyltransferase n=1 Tax=Neisseria canis TaxID=493 RepID=A0A1X3CYS8_9NEIS|nr:CDP-alcohol phosphatidyltransferase family protein [Neisseria canis]OSI12584.1 CDP-diacylglycerol--glycerol-3-phosphate 3-phosphatidyltransferase [Neisseria canis]VEF03482.1 CDP-alcohol phosphatidyltransferase [Neisseria canis]
MTTHDNRRPIASRSNKLMVRFAAWLAAKDSPTPNQISILSAVFAACGAGLLAYSQHAAALVGCAIFIQLRLMCNLLDGMVAVEGGKKTDTGEIFNEFPDRVADSVLIVALGYAIGQGWLGWLGALLAMATAYIRVFGGSLGFPQDFLGPMAKQHRMAVLTLGCLLGAVESHYNQTNFLLGVSLVAIVIGSAITCYKRTQAIAELMRLRADQVRGEQAISEDEAE